MTSLTIEALQYSGRSTSPQSTRAFTAAEARVRAGCFVLRFLKEPGFKAALARFQGLRVEGAMRATIGEAPSAYS